MTKGLIIKSQGGFYDVESLEEKTIWCCRPRGLFRKEGITPKVGDQVEFQPVTHLEEGADAAASKQNQVVGTINVIHPRKNELVRPLLANLDQLFLVNSICDPAPSLFLIDSLLATAEHQGILPVLVFTKIDRKGTVDPSQSPEEIYASVGVPVFSLHHQMPQQDPVLQQLKEMMQGKISAFIGNSGVGKSTLLNLLFPQWELQTGDISKKLGRGRHTTRHVELLRLPHTADAYVADTPGFGTMEFLRYQQSVSKEDLPALFREFLPYLGGCRFQNCSHTVEQNCAVLEALHAGEICPSRHKSYTMLYEEMRQMPDWKKK